MIGQNWGLCDIISILLIKNLSLIETVGPSRRCIVNQWNNKLRDHCILLLLINTGLVHELLIYLICFLNSFHIVANIKSLGMLNQLQTKCVKVLILLVFLNFNSLL